MNPRRASSAASSWSSLVALVCSLLLASPASAAPRKKSGKDEAAAISQVAAAKHTAGDFPLCASLYHQAFRTDPTFLGYLFSAARCEQKAGNLEAAERDYRRFLELSPEDEPLNEKARAWLEETLQAQKAAEAEKKAAEDKLRQDEEKKNELPPPPPPPPPKPSYTRAWVATIGGGVLVLAGGALVANGLALRSDLDAKLAHGGGLVVDMTPDQARAEESTWRLRTGVGTGVAVAGLVAVGAGVWWFGHPKVTLVPGPTAAGAGVAFAWR